ncbi:MAG: HAD hydrolase-like protein [Eubacteriales bacterium]
MICGKPAIVIHCVQLSAPKERIVMVGDRLNTDIRFGVNAFTLFLSAEQAETSCDRAEAVAESLNEIAEYL